MIYLQGKPVYVINLEGIIYYVVCPHNVSFSNDTIIKANVKGVFCTRMQDVQVQFDFNLLFAITSGTTKLQLNTIHAHS